MAKKKNGGANGKLNGHVKPNGIGEGRNSLPTTRRVIESGRQINANRNAEVLADQYRPEMAAEAATMVLNGATERDLIVAFKTTRTVFNLWKVQYPEFAQALIITSAAAMCDENVKRSMYEMAMGYEQEAVKIMNVDGDVRAIKYVERVQKNYNAAKFWLMNRKPEEFGRDPDAAKGGNDTRPVNQINISMVRDLGTDQLKNTIALLQQLVTPNNTLRRLDGSIAEGETIPVTQDSNGDGKD